MQEILVAIKPGETKYACILRLLRCNSLAQAVAQHKLEDYEGDVWVKLEGFAVREVTMRRTTAKFSRTMSAIRRHLS